MSRSSDYGGYSLTSVTWGYRDIFSKTIQRLFDEGYLGPEREEITRQFFSLLRCSEAGLYDHVLKEFLDSLTGASAWIFDLPAIFGEIIRTGSQFAEAKMFYGIEFYRILKDGGFGDSPEKVQFLLTLLKRLGKIDMELSFAFLKGYARMLERLHLPEIHRFADEGVRLFRQNTRMGIRFLECRLGSSEAYFQELTRECRLEDTDATLERLLRALTGKRLHAHNLSALDSDQLVTRGSMLVCLPGQVVYPDRIRRFPDRDHNYRWYLLSTICAAAYVNTGGVATGAAGNYLAGCDAGTANAVVAVSHARAVDYVLRHWPGAGDLLGHALKEELLSRTESSGVDELLASVLSVVAGRASAAGPVRRLLDIAGESGSVSATIQAVTKAEDLLADIEAAFPGFQFARVSPLSFLPDLLYNAPKAVDTPVTGQPLNDADQQSDGDAEAQVAEDGDSTQKSEAKLDDDDESETSGDEHGETAEEADEEAIRRKHYVYDEWSNEEGAYYRAHCTLYEERPPESMEGELPPTMLEQVAKVKRIFEMLKPVLNNKIKRLSEGDEINHDLLIQYLVDSRFDPSPKIDFYERPLINRRDLSVLVLLDVSGSTDEEVDGGKILDIEKHAALVLGQGLSSLGDDFAICGFNSNGKDNCRFLLFKEFDDEWGDPSITQLFSAQASSSTRIGAALRHAGRKLKAQPSRQRLIILITDDRPMDQGYDPETRYAQHDVRMACVENKKAEILTFCVSTMDNSRADMEIMFPEQRFAILNDIAKLPAVLPQLYLRLTT